MLRLKSAGLGLALGSTSFAGSGCCVYAGATSWSGTRATGVSGSANSSSEVLSSLSNEDCRWSLSSERQRVN